MQKKYGTTECVDTGCSINATISGGQNAIESDFVRQHSNAAFAAAAAAAPAVDLQEFNLNNCVMKCACK